MYRCGKCGERFESLSDGVIRCPVCAYKVLYKERIPITKEVKGR